MQKIVQEQYSQLQRKLKTILQISLKLIKPYLQTKQQLNQLQSFLLDYQNNQQLVDIIQNVIKMIYNLTNKISTTIENKNYIHLNQYQLLQDNLRIFQAKERKYIKNQYQLKLYCEQLQTKIKQLELSKNQIIISTKKVILDLKRDNQDLINKLKSYHPHSSPANKSNDPVKYDSSRKTNGQSASKIHKNTKPDKLQNHIKNKIQQCQQVIQSIQTSKGKKSNYVNQTKQKNSYDFK